MSSSLLPFFSPTGVAILGASSNPIKLGYSLANNLLHSGYTGAVHFVNPSGGTLLERPLYPSLAEVPDPVDLAVLLIPAPTVPKAVAECGQRGIRAVILASGGFRETGPEGAALEDEVVRVAREYNIRLIGPNCIGLLDTHLPLDTTFLPPPGPTPGDVAFLSHSGAICAAVIDWARGQGFGLSRLVSLGNQADVTETDVLVPVAGDPHTRVLTLYLEGIRDGQRFVREASKVTRQKPVIALKVGRFKSGQQAVASHTGALAGQETAYNAAFRRAGVIRAETSEEMFDWARALAWCPLPKGRRVAVLTNAGGPGVTAADALEMYGLELASLSPETVTALQTFLPPAASFRNPVDMLASASPEHYARSLSALLDDPNVDSVMIILPPPPAYTAGGVARAMIPIIQSARKPVVVAVMGERMIQEAVEYFRAARVPEYRFPERAAAALNVLTRRAESLAREVEAPLCRADVCPERVYRALSLVSPQDHPLSFRPQGGIPETSLDPEAPQGFLVAKRRMDIRPRNDSFLSQDIALQILEAYSIPTLGMELARNADEAGEIAARIGFPVALKVASPDIPHKSDVGGVLLDVRDQDAVRAGFATVIEAAKRAKADAVIEGVHLQRMVSAGQEVITGTVRDAQFGPLVMFGSGGVEVEGLKDVAFALAPATRGEIEEMLEKTWAGRKLRGFRNLPPADREAVVDVLIRLGQLAADFPQLAEIEINPLRVLGEGAVALDVRVRVIPSSP